MTLAWYRVPGILLLALGAAMPALAQDQRKAEVSVGYQLITFDGDDVDETFSRGWYADVAGNLGPIFAVVVQVGGSYKSFEETETWKRVRADFETVKGRAPKYAAIPDVALVSPKMTKKRTTRWFAEMVETRYRSCLTRGAPKRG